MEKILLLVHTQTDGTLARPALEALAVARRFAEAMPGSALMAGIVGGQVQEAARSIGNCGAARWFGVGGDAFNWARYSTDAAAAEAIARAAEATIIVAPGTSRWSRTLAGVAQRLNGSIDTHVVAVDPSVPAVTRWYYRQRIEAVQSRMARPWIILLDAGAADPFEPAAGAVNVEMLTVKTPPDLLQTEVFGTVAQKTGEQTIRPDASLLFVAGAGWTKKQQDGQVHLPEAEKTILDFVRQAQCSLGSSKSLVDLSCEGQTVLPFLTHLHQVGQTGSTPRHPKGLATCCHGEEPHVVGWRFIHERRAVNLDPNCGWARGKADVLYVADAFEVMAKVIALLRGE